MSRKLWPLAWRQVDAALKANPKLTILLENTAGAGAQLGGDLEDLATIRAIADAVPRHSDRLLPRYLPLLCERLRHWHASRPRSRSSQKQTQRLGSKHVLVMHANDAKAPLDSHLDRHANIGAGYIGLEGFRRILNHPDLREKAFILETPGRRAG